MSVARRSRSGVVLPTAPRSGSSGPDGSRDPATAGSWDPLVRPVALAVLVVALLYNSAAINGIPGTVIPNTFPLLLGLAAIGLALIVPRHRELFLPLGAVGLLVLSVCSVAWSQNQEATILWLRSAGIVTIGITALVLVLPTADTILAMKWFIRIALCITIVAVAIEPLARIHIDPLGQSPPLNGWHGYFVHKNILAAFLIFALAATISFDKNRWTRWPTFAAILFFLVVSDSTTGRMSAVMLVAVQLWFRVNRRLNRRSSMALVASTGVLVAIGATAVAATLSAIADAAGKDLTFTGRTKIWAASWDAITRIPVLGHGVNGLFTPPMTVETESVFRQIGFPAGHPHNGFLDVGVQLGAVGVVVVLIVVISIFRSSLRIQRRAPDLSSWGLSLISAMVIMSVGESVFLGSAVAVLVMLRTLTLREMRGPQRGLQTASARRSRWTD